MWFKLAGATFTNNLGTMDSISKSYMMDYSGLTGLSASPGSVSYASDSTPDATITFTVKSGYVFKSGSKVTASGGASKTYTASADIAAGNSFTMALTGISNKVTFVGAAELVSGGNTGGGEPETPVNYTFTLNPTPTSATVTLSATGYSTVSGTGSKSITVANGTKVNWSVSASGYTTRTGDWTISGGNKTESIALTATGGGGTGGDTSNLLTENPYFVTTGIPTQATTSSYGTQIGYDYGGFICKGIKSVSTGKGNSFNVYTGTKGSDGYIGNTEKVETFTYTKEKGIEEEFLFNSPIDLTGDTRLTCNGSFMWRQSTTEEQNNPPQGVRRLQTNTPLYYYWYIFQ